MEKNKRTVETIGMFKAFLDSIGVKKTEDIEKITEQVIQEMYQKIIPEVDVVLCFWQQITDSMPGYKEHCRN